MLGLILGAAPALARWSNAGSSGEARNARACYQRQEKELAAKRKPAPRQHQDDGSLEQMRRKTMPFTRACAASAADADGQLARLIS
jgi:hypothetical protein